MTQTAQRLKDELARLSSPDRAELARFLINSLDTEVDDEVDAAWAAELDRRAGEAQTGLVAGVPAEKVMADLKQKHS